MTQLVIDNDTRRRLANLAEFLEFRDEGGNLLGYFHPTPPSEGMVSGHPVSPFTDQEIEARRKQRGGSSLADVLKRLPAT